MGKGKLDKEAQVRLKGAYAFSLHEFSNEFRLPDALRNLIKYPVHVCGGLKEAFCEWNMTRFLSHPCFPVTALCLLMEPFMGMKTKTNSLKESISLCAF